MQASEIKQSAIGKFRDKTATIGIVGLGYVGLPLMLRYAETGFKVLGFDIDAEKVNKLNNGETYIEHTSRPTKSLPPAPPVSKPPPTSPASAKRKP